MIKLSDLGIKREDVINRIDSLLYDYKRTALDALHMVDLLREENQLLTARVNQLESKKVKKK